MAQPKGLIPPLGEALLAAETPRQIAENVEIVARIADGFDRLVHRDDEPVARRAAQIVTLKRGRRRQYDVGMARGRRPPRLVDDDCFRALPRAAQPVHVPMVMKRVAADPLDEPYVGIGGTLAVTIVPLIRVQQAVGNAAAVI